MTGGGGKIIDLATWDIPVPYIRHGTLGEIMDRECDIAIS